MKEVQGNIWHFHRGLNILLITTNGYVKNNGECVMGRGVAKQAKAHFPELPLQLGNWIKINGNVPVYFDEYRVVTFPVKHHWYDDKADLVLIERSAQAIVKIADNLDTYLSVKHNYYSVRPGCGNGNLLWEVQVKPVIEKIFDGRFTIVEETLCT